MVIFVAQLKKIVRNKPKIAQEPSFAGNLEATLYSNYLGDSPIPAKLSIATATFGEFSTKPHRDQYDSAGRYTNMVHPLSHSRVKQWRSYTNLYHSQATSTLGYPDSSTSDEQAEHCCPEGCVRHSKRKRVKTIKPHTQAGPASDPTINSALGSSKEFLAQITASGDRPCTNELESANTVPEEINPTTLRRLDEVEDVLGFETTVVHQELDQGLRRLVQFLKAPLSVASLFGTILYGHVWVQRHASRSGRCVVNFALRHARLFFSAYASASGNYFPTCTARGPPSRSWG
ncbi:hypothetical protein GGX14DRAFT_406236 [Mycena pura]|uniref:Uncharacterized protein n=1 Tax=Mycena pura TaxID=153505 RepID=A0AAD6USE4_9AGAR|nr:hypothetical protein GGX14DRAFT_406236 [Mycena pura]